LQHVEKFKGGDFLGDKHRIKDANKIIFKKIMDEFESDLCSPLYDIVVVFLLYCVS
jgi:hypothetical protein